jgi:hypothetical protein
MLSRDAYRKKWNAGQVVPWTTRCKRSGDLKALRIHWSELRYLHFRRRSASVNHVVTSVASAVSNCNVVNDIHLDLPKSSNECPGDTKCWLTGKSVFFVRSLLCPFILLLNGWTLSPTYCDPQTWHRELQTLHPKGINQKA